MEIKQAKQLSSQSKTGVKHTHKNKWINKWERERECKVPTVISASSNKPLFSTFYSI